MSTFFKFGVKIECMDGDLKWLKPELRRRGESITSLAESMGKSRVFLTNVINGKRNAGIDTYRDIARSLRLPLGVVLSRSGILPPLDPDDEQILTILGKLDPETKKEVLDFAKFKDQSQKTPSD
jgi:transcriptional regulator with XRE-family HTH domain